MLIKNTLITLFATNILSLENVDVQNIVDICKGTNFLINYN